MNDDYTPRCFSVSNVELEAATSITTGDSLDCDRCNEKHVVNSDESGILQFVRCCGTSYLVGVKGKNVIRRNSGGRV